MKSLQYIGVLTVAFVFSAASAEGQTTAKKPSTTAPKVSQPVAKPASAATKPATAKPVAAKPAPVVQETAQATPQQQPANAKPTSSANQATASAAQPQRTSTPAQPRAGATSGARKPMLTSGHRTSYLNGGIGLASYWGGGIPIGVSFETTIMDNVSVGGSIDYAHYGRNYGGYKWNYNFIYAGARGSYHFGELLETGDKFDPYAGISLGFRYASYKDSYGYSNDYYNPYNSGLYLGIHVGGRYYFTDKIGGFAEVGYGVSALRLGVTAKF